MLGTIKRHRRITAIVAGVAGTMMVSSIAWAYFTGGGTGAGTATVSSTSPTLVVAQTTVTLDPGSPAIALAGTISNPNGISVMAGVLDAKITSVTGGGTPSDFVLYLDEGGNPPLGINKVIAPRSSINWSGMWLAINDSSTVNQDYLKGATVTISYTVTTPAGS